MEAERKWVHGKCKTHNSATRSQVGYQTALKENNVMVSEGGVPDCHLSPDQKDGSHPYCIITLSFDPVGKRVLILIVHNYAK